MQSQSQTQQLKPMSAVTVVPFEWIQSKADMEDMELARAIEVYVSTIKLDPAITEAFPEVYIVNILFFIIHI